MEEKKMIGKYDWTTMLIITIFLGSLGVHNFMLGETKKGLVKLIATLLMCTSIVSLVLWIMDLIKIIKNEYEINTEAWY